jgi:hypothetical protein
LIISDQLLKELILWTNVDNVDNGLPKILLPEQAFRLLRHGPQTCHRAGSRPGVGAASGNTECQTLENLLQKWKNASSVASSVSVHPVLSHTLKCSQSFQSSHSSQSSHPSQSSQSNSRRALGARILSHLASQLDTIGHYQTILRNLGEEFFKAMGRWAASC